MGMAIAGSSQQARPQRDLDQLLLTLPQELFDRSYSETFTAGHQTISVNLEDVRAEPKLLGISRASNAIFAESYYANSSFKFDSLGTSQVWLGDLEDTYRGMLNVITIVRSRPWDSVAMPDDYWSTWEGVAREMTDHRFGHGLGAKLAFVDPDQTSS